MKATIYANYGVLAHERQTIYTADNQHVYAKCSDRITIEIPDKFHPYVIADDSIALMINGIPYMLYEVLATTADDNPCFMWYNDSGRHIERIDVVKR